jgi:excisionase family DNA binding protein
MPEASTLSGDVDIAGAAAELGTSTKFVRRRISDKTLPAYRIRGSRLIRIRRADLEALKLPVVCGGAP